MIIGLRASSATATNIILANKLDGVRPHGTAYYPLRLVGPRIGADKFLGRITKIHLLPK